ncbi:MAG: glycoside hydrolase family 2 [Oscillospiraceae bacterium]|nr:glycoside hydrolase family 2 [Oscillospiraceae bacterium]
MLNDLYTARGEEITKAPWQEYPRPQLKRDSYVNLNGPWDFVISNDSKLPEEYNQEIVVPFCPECMLSLADVDSYTGKWLFYRRSFTLPDGFRKGKVLLHIGAADQTAKIYVNQKLVGDHVGGYEAFSMDITAALEEENEIVVAVYDDLRDTTLPYGKQTLKRGGMWYTPVSGIWQTVWLESVPEQYIENLDIQVTLESATISVTPALSGKILLEDKEYPLSDGKAVITPENPRHWTPEDPYLYHFSIETEFDRVESYFALRAVETKEINGIPRLCLNGKPYFFHGLLDQGYWSDGIYTPASPACFEADILKMKELGFNTLRKHIKVEPELFYYACDRLGMVVFQDMVNNGDYSFFRDTALPTIGIQKRNDKKMHRDENTRKAFLRGMESTVKQLKNHPCILYWTIFNEGWGQFDGSAAYEQLKSLDSSRIIDTTSGWFRGTETDVDSRHIYYTPWSALKPSDKPLVLSEFGGYAYAVEGHLFNPDKAYGYKTCKSREHFQTSLSELYITKVLPAIDRGLCAAIITQVSDVEDEINGMLTYDRRVCKADAESMRQIATALQDAFAASCIAPLPQD